MILYPFLWGWPVIFMAKGAPEIFWGLKGWGPKIFHDKMFLHQTPLQVFVNGPLMNMPGCKATILTFPSVLMDGLVSTSKMIMTQTLISLFHCVNYCFNFSKTYTAAPYIRTWIWHTLSLRAQINVSLLTLLPWYPGGYSDLGWVRMCGPEFQLLPHSKTWPLANSQPISKPHFSTGTHVKTNFWACSMAKNRWNLPWQ